MNLLPTNPSLIAEIGTGTYSSEKPVKSNSGTKIFFIRNKFKLPVALHDSGKFTCFTSIDFDEAIQHIKALPKTQLPEAILCYYDKNGLSEIDHFSQMLKQHHKLRPIPFILVRDNENPDAYQDTNTISGIDDMVHSTISANELCNKIKLLNKIKFLNSLKDKTAPIRSDNSLRSVSEKKRYLLIKRTLDICITLLILCCAAPIMLLIALIIKLESKGPVFYESYRSGSDYRVFKFIKFRSMVSGAEQALPALSGYNQYGNTGGNKGVFFKISNDPRVTKFGTFLRNSSLDELPQLFNVLKGDMSIVGNRPLPLYEAKALTTDQYAERFNAPAGITGLWQVKKRGQKEMSSEERIALDIAYAKNHSLLFDLKIILDTPKALAQKDNV